MLPAEGHCSNLQQITVPLYETCQSVCAKRPYCSTYAENATGCYVGDMTAGLKCFNRQLGEASRILHGAVRVLQDLRQVRVLGLTKAGPLLALAAAAAGLSRSRAGGRSPCCWRGGLSYGLLFEPQVPLLAVLSRRRRGLS